MNSSRNIQFLKFIIVGGINTAVTLLVIMLCKSVIGIDPYLSNVYLMGLVQQDGERVHEQRVLHIDV